MGVYDAKSKPRALWISAPPGRTRAATGRLSLGRRDEGRPADRLRRGAYDDAMSASFVALLERELLDRKRFPTQAAASSTALQWA